MIQNMSKPLKASIEVSLFCGRRDDFDGWAAGSGQGD
jgi:hypothetical protein